MVTNATRPSAETSPLVTASSEPSASVDAGSDVAITFGSGPSVVDRAAGNSLADGNYELRINGTAIFGEQPEDNFFRLFGDGNGDGVTNIFDFSESFLPSFGLSSASDGFKGFMDFDGNDVVNIFDFSNGYLPNFGSSR